MPVVPASIARISGAEDTATTLAVAFDVDPIRVDSGEGRGQLMTVE